jgi:hypothetical protein
MLTGRKVKAPEPLLERYPELRDIAETGPSPGSAEA